MKEIVIDHHQDIKKSFRDAMAQLGAGVNIITTNGAMGRCGLTATAVVSITDTPPTMLVSINQNSASNAAFKAHNRMAVNILSAEQQEAAEYFGGMHPVSMEERFERFEFTEGPSDLPLLKGALANLEGRVTATYEVGTHTLFILELDYMAISDDQNAGLLYFNRQFRQIDK
ncbi:4-hydroxyphenylacetate 3-monooxygenase reductase component [Ignatzschineria indica]|uniref:4-hydroxyphenylacetate 3-monooxygenase reductase subunit n=2 Tax=Ignatzschineria TaxID=112008 RepID=A0ABX5L264_9GAMM|nr:MULTISPECIES: flavin reductase [Ignatzschineria]MDM1544657.1 flavin reductase [Ignatzschineria indica]PWD84399.1 4-hydroxyphenylacetate 3-monooxygenase reductase subunit [Ignatzschineria indica]PWD90479.1 4-hydroxyphenylacetate 3-monooxygenase reductase subunit [Ignatzschineria cameli]PWD92363.1 4-hydroxyphenylacetate 3-monooxygenase reductase subunit [Ignatzschineria cameli]PWD93156.1 4-hydroxyphenylacetate 3-monooxygenase reductase subunit [Ignatzschineria cameli]